MNKNRYMLLIWIAVWLFGLCFLTGCDHSENKGAETAFSADVTEEKDYLLQNISKLREAPNANTIFVTVYTGANSDCNFYAFEKKNGSWNFSFYAKGYLGANGVMYADRKEGNRTTPGGVFSLDILFGIHNDPGGLKKDYLHLSDEWYWDGNIGSPTYNQLVNIKDMPETWDKQQAEHLIDYKGSYDYAASIGFNKDPVVQGMGSAIFLHCTSAGSDSSAGCVAIPKAEMLRALQMIDDQSYIVILEKINHFTRYF